MTGVTPVGVGYVEWRGTNAEIERNFPSLKSTFTKLNIVVFLRMALQLLILDAH